MKFISENFDVMPEELQVSLSQVYAQGWLAGLRGEAAKFESPQSNIDEGHV